MKQMKSIVLVTVVIALCSTACKKETPKGISAVGTTINNPSSAFFNGVYKYNDSFGQEHKICVASFEHNENQFIIYDSLTQLSLRAELENDNQFKILQDTLSCSNSASISFEQNGTILNNGLTYAYYIEYLNGGFVENNQISLQNKERSFSGKLGNNFVGKYCGGTSLLNGGQGGLLIFFINRATEDKFNIFMSSFLFPLKIEAYTNGKKNELFIPEQVYHVWQNVYIPIEETIIHIDEFGEKISGELNVISDNISYQIIFNDVEKE